MGDEVPKGPEQKEEVKKAPEKPKDKEPVSKEGLKATADQNTVLAKKYDGLKKGADAKKPEGYDPAKYPPVDQLPVPKLSWQKTGLKPLDVLKPGGLGKAVGEAGDALKAGPRREATAMERSGINGPTSTASTNVDMSYSKGLADRIDGATKPKIFVSPPIKF